MKNIEPVVYTSSGEICTKLKVWSTYDDMESWISLAWMLLTEEGASVDSGALRCDGEDYANWDRGVESAYTWVAANISNPVTIID